MNVFAAPLDDHEFATRILSTVESYELPPNRVTIEVTESTVIIEFFAVAERLDWLRRVGVTISHD